MDRRGELAAGLRIGLMGVSEVWRAVLSAFETFAAGLLWVCLAEQGVVDCSDGHRFASAGATGCCHARGPAAFHLYVILI